MNVFPRLTMDTSGTVLRIPASYLKVGYYLVTFTARIFDNGLAKTVERFLNVIPGALSAIINGGTSQTLSWQHNIVLDASSSSDPRDTSAVLDFKWYCEYMLDINTTAGCFGEKSADTIKHFGAVWVVPARTLAKGINYLFTVKVISRQQYGGSGSNEVREATAQQNVLLKEILILQIE